MNNEEAKRQLESAYPYLSNEVKLALDKAIEALEKQIPKKPIGKVERPEEVGKIGYHNCPICNYIVSGRYCSYCGQRIDWSEDND